MLLFLLFFQVPFIQLKTAEETYLLNTDTFTLSWIHSVEKEKWHEIYVREGKDLVLTETYFKTFGAGVPSEGKVIKVEDGYVHMEINRKIDEINIVVSNNVKTTLDTKNQVIPLYDLVEDYNEINISVKYIHLWELFGRRYL